jgi:hypothetical protein
MSRLNQFLQSLPNQRLLDLIHSGELIDEDRPHALQEATRRGLVDGDGNALTTAPEVSMVPLERGLSRDDALSLVSFLGSIGIHAGLYDVRRWQESYLSIPFAGLSVCVLEDQLAEAQSAAQAFRSGAFTLPDDFPVDDIESN